MKNGINTLDRNAQEIKSKLKKKASRQKCSGVNVVDQKEKCSKLQEKEVISDVCCKAVTNINNWEDKTRGLCALPLSSGLMG